MSNRKLARCIHCQRWHRSGARYCNKCTREIPKEQRIPSPRKPKRAKLVRPTSSGIISAAIEALQLSGSYPTTAEIVVAAWKLAPQRLGLPGFKKEYPNSNRVVSELVGLVKRGLVERPEKGRYRIARKEEATCTSLTTD